MITSGVLLDSHILLWLAAKKAFSAKALLEISKARSSKRLYTSHISIWEMGVSLTKKRIHLVPDLGGKTPGVWFHESTLVVVAQALPISAEIAAEAALVPAIYGSGDPGDCFLIATARIHHLTFVTRDKQVLDLAEQLPAYLSAISC